MMFLNSWRWRASSYVLLQISVSGTPMSSMSGAASPAGSARIVVEQIAAGLDRGDVLVPGLGVHGDHQVDAPAPGEPAGFAHPHLVPGRQALDVGGEDVARRRPALPSAGWRGRTAGWRLPNPTVDVRELDDEVVDGAQRHRLSGPAIVVSRRNFCISQAPVGQRSAQRPQWRQTSSSFTMIRPVLSACET